MMMVKAAVYWGVVHTNERRGRLQGGQGEHLQRAAATELLSVGHRVTEQYGETHTRTHRLQLECLRRRPRRGRRSPSKDLVALTGVLGLVGTETATSHNTHHTHIHGESTHRLELGVEVEELTEVDLPALRHKNGA
jgi:hypothetical protein